MSIHLNLCFVEPVVANEINGVDVRLLLENDLVHGQIVASNLL